MENKKESDSDKPLTMTKNEGEKPKSIATGIIYLSFITLLAVLTALFAKGILKFMPPSWENSAGGEILPYYRTFIHYPREEVMNNGMIVLLFLITIYLCLDFLFLRGLRGWIKVMTVLLSVFIIIGGTEWAADFYSRIYPEMHRPSAALLWKLSPSLNGVRGGKYVYTNSHGFRSPELPMKKPPGQIRIMILGDSSAFGFRVKNKETFGAVTVRLLRKKYHGKDIRLINASVAGWTTYQARVFMKEKGWKFSPDIIIIAFNDDSQDEWEEDADRAPSPQIMPLMKLLYRSHIYLSAKKLILNASIMSDASKVVNPPEKNARKRVSPKQFRANFDYIIDGALGRGAKVIAVSMPVQQSAGYFSNYRNIQKKAVEEEDFPFIDLMEEFQKYPESEVFIDLMHPTVKGHRIIGEKLYELIVNTGWLDK